MSTQSWWLELNPISSTKLFFVYFDLLPFSLCSLNHLNNYRGLCCEQIRIDLLLWIFPLLPSLFFWTFLIFCFIWGYLGCYRVRVCILLSFPSLDYHPTLSIPSPSSLLSLGFWLIHLHMHLLMWTFITCMPINIAVCTEFRDSVICYFLLYDPC